jgi:hypothetical protein
VIRLVPTIALALVGLAGCGGDDAGSTTESGTLVAYARTGGFASMPESLVIGADGAGTVEAGVDPARESFQLDADDLEQVGSELETADFDAVDSGVPTSCADCYEYEIAYNGTTVSYDESQDVPESVDAAVAHLGEIADAHYPAEADQPPILN